VSNYGSGIQTRWQFYVNPQRRVVEQYTQGNGDGTVPELSAVNRNPERAAVSLTQHATIFDDDSVSVTLRRILTNLDMPQNRNATEFSVLTDNDVVLRVLRIGFGADSGIVSVGERLLVSAQLIGDPGAALERVPLTLTITGPDGTHDFPLVLSASEDGPLVSHVVFTANIGPFFTPGAVRINLRLKGAAKAFDDFVAVVSGHD